jgi:dimethylamine monooxygenase subunit A
VLRHFPFEESFDPGMGMRVLKPHEPLCEVDLGRYQEEISLKQHLLTEAHTYYFQGGEATMTAQWDVLELVASNLAQNYPEHFGLQRESDSWRWQNALTEATTTFRFGDCATLPYDPLDWIGRQVQEDLVLLSGDASASFTGGQLCFANGWAISDRLGKSFLEIHQRTPQATMPSVEMGARFLQMLKQGRTYWRLSWNFKLSNQMDMTTKHKPAYKADFARRAPMLTVEDVGDAVFLRIERQTFTRLPRSGGLLFGIHTYNSSVAEEAADRGRAQAILNSVRGAPRDVKEYKAITPIEGPLVSFLEARASSQCALRAL